MLERILIAGSGGQGVLLAGKLLADVALNEIPTLTYFPAYGAEVRGGTSHCQIIFSDTEIASPEADGFDWLLLMNEVSLRRFLPRRAPNSTVLVNSSLCPVPASENVSGIAATAEAERLGNARAANFVMLGAFLQRSGLVPVSPFEAATRRLLAGKDPRLIDINLKAFHVGQGLQSQPRKGQP
jgi:2-oxoglutarate ferredoxin oxidoreductase subunit gamma